MVPGWVQLLGAASMSAGGGANWWEYLLLFLAVMASWAGVPAVGSAALGAAAVGASQGNLNLAAIIVIAAIAGEIGGLIGYRIGFRWGSQLLDRPGKRQAGRQKLKDKGELAYAKWGGWRFSSPRRLSRVLRGCIIANLSCGTSWRRSPSHCQSQQLRMALGE